MLESQGNLRLVESSPLKMSTVKGILKGLRYISQIFEKEEEEEEEIQIGNPTDVKHVAHIGNEGPSNNKPSWMKEASSEAKSNGKSATKSSSKEVQNSSDAPCDSSSKSEKKKQSKRHAAKAYIGSIGSSARDPNGTAKPRRPKNSNVDSQIGLDSPSRDPNTPQKSSRPKKSKAGSSKSKAQNAMNDDYSSSPGPAYERDNGKISQGSAS